MRAIQFRPYGTAEVSIDPGDIRKLLKAIAQIEESREKPDEKILEATKLLNHHLGDWDDELKEEGVYFWFSADVMIAIHGVRLHPFWPPEHIISRDEIKALKEKLVSENPELFTVNRGKKGRGQT